MTSSSRLCCSSQARAAVLQLKSAARGALIRAANRGMEELAMNIRAVTTVASGSLKAKSQSAEFQVMRPSACHARLQEEDGNESIFAYRRPHAVKSLSLQGEDRQHSRSNAGSGTAPGLRARGKTTAQCVDSVGNDPAELERMLPRRDIPAAAWREERFRAQQILAQTAWNGNHKRCRWEEDQEGKTSGTSSFSSSASQPGERSCNMEHHDRDRVDFVRDGKRSPATARVPPRQSGAPGGLTSAIRRLNSSCSPTGAGGVKASAADAEEAARDILQQLDTAPARPWEVVALLRALRKRNVRAVGLLERLKEEIILSTAMFSSADQAEIRAVYKHFRVKFWALQDMNPGGSDPTSAGAAVD